MSLTITINTATPLLDRVLTAAQSAGLALIGARAGGELVRTWLFALNAERHRFGNNYYAQAARSVNTVQISSSSAAIGITQVGLRQRLQGGMIFPRAGREYLTIPASQEAYGHRAKEFNDLDFAFVATGDGGFAPALVRRASTAIKFSRRKQKDGSIRTSIKPAEIRGGEVMFWLRRHVNQKADPSVLPPIFDVAAKAISAINSYFNRRIAGQST